MSWSVIYSGALDPDVCSWHSFQVRIFYRDKQRQCFFIHSLYSMWKTSVFAHVSCNLLQRLKWIADRVQQYVWQSCEVVHANICRYSECWQGPWEESGAAEGDACRCSETCISTKKGPNWSANQWHLENVNVSIYTCSVPHKPKHNTSNWDCSYHVCSVHHFLSVLCEKNYLFFPPFLKIRKKTITATRQHKNCCLNTGKIE